MIGRLEERISLNLVHTLFACSHDIIDHWLSVAVSDMMEEADPSALSETESPGPSHKYSTDATLKRSIRVVEAEEQVRQLPRLYILMLWSCTLDLENLARLIIGCVAHAMSFRYLSQKGNVEYKRLVQARPARLRSLATQVGGSQESSTTNPPIFICVRILVWNCMAFCSATLSTLCLTLTLTFFDVLSAMVC
jgi:hypothetical protein